MSEQRLADALSRAADEVPLYGSRDWRAALAQDRPERIGAWPVLERETVRNQHRELLARRRPAGTFYRHSSASTGAPLAVAYDPQAAAWSWAGEHRAALWHGVPVGARTLKMWGGKNSLLDWIKHSHVFNAKELNAARLAEAALGRGLRTFLSKAPPAAVGQVLFRQIDRRHWQVLVESAQGFDASLVAQHAFARPGDVRRRLRCGGRTRHRRAAPQSDTERQVASAGRL